MKQTARPATAAEITEIVGPLDDAVLMRIIETEATPAEVLEAFTRATDDDQIGTELEHRPRGAVARVYEILKREEPEPDEPQGEPRIGRRCRLLLGAQRRLFPAVREMRRGSHGPIPPPTLTFYGSMMSRS